MANLPERVSLYARPNGLEGRWFAEGTVPDEEYHPYVRADLHAALRAQRDEARAALARVDTAMDDLCWRVGEDDRLPWDMVRDSIAAALAAGGTTPETPPALDTGASQQGAE